MESWVWTQRPYYGVETSTYSRNVDRFFWLILKIQNSKKFSTKEKHARKFFTNLQVFHYKCSKPLDKEESRSILSRCSPFTKLFKIFKRIVHLLVESWDWTQGPYYGAETSTFSRNVDRFFWLTHKIQNSKKFWTKITCKEKIYTNLQVFHYSCSKPLNY